MNAAQLRKIQSALFKAEALLDSVAFVSDEGDTAEPLEAIREALAILETLRGQQ